MTCEGCDREDVPFTFHEAARLTGGVFDHQLLLCDQCELKRFRVLVALHGYVPWHKQ
jgi:hypothetical protein